MKIFGSDSDCIRYFTPTNNDDHLYSNCIHNTHFCRDLKCKDAVKVNKKTGRWYITMGHAGFNLPANNGSGYKTKNTALSAIKRCLK